MFHLIPTTLAVSRVSEILALILFFLGCTAVLACWVAGAMATNEQQAQAQAQAQDDEASED